VPAPPDSGEEDEHLRHLGVPTFDDGRITSIVEKPEQPPSKFGVHWYLCSDANVFGVIPSLGASGRGALEITDVNNQYIDEGSMPTTYWKDFGDDDGESIDAYYAVNDFVRAHGANRAESSLGSSCGSFRSIVSDTHRMTQRPRHSPRGDPTWRRPQNLVAPFDRR